MSPKRKSKSIVCTMPPKRKRQSVDKSPTSTTTSSSDTGSSNWESIDRESCETDSSDERQNIWVEKIRKFNKLPRYYSTKCGRYTFMDKELGCGGCGTVYLAKDRDGSLVAIKIFKSKKSDFNESGLPIEVEMLINTQDITGVLKLVDHYHMVDNRYAIVTEYDKNSIDYWTYNFEHCKKEIVPPGKAQNHFKQMTTILCDMMDKRIAHRDVKNENFLINLLTDKITLIDFGHASFISCGDKHSCGTPNHLPPEYRKYGQYSDDSVTVYALGIILHQMIEGYDASKNMRTSFTRIRMSSFTNRRNDVYPYSAKLLCVQCLEHDPKHRIRLNKILDSKWLR